MRNSEGLELYQSVEGIEGRGGGVQELPSTFAYALQ